MHEKSGHRKQVRHFDEPKHCHELKRMPLLTNNTWREMLSWLRKHVDVSE